MIHLCDRLEDLGAPGAEGLAYGFRDTNSLEIAVLADFADLVAELLDGQTKSRHRHRIEKRVVLPELVVAQRAPFAIRPLGDIGHDSVEVRIGFLVAVRIVLEKADDEVPCGEDALLAFDLHPGFGEVLLGPDQGLLHRCGIGIEDTLVAAYEREDRPALGHRESKIGAGTVSTVVATDPAAIGEQTLEHRFELLGIDLADEPQLFGPLSQPFARSFGIGTGVVIVRSKVVGGAACGADIGYRKHGPPRKG